MSALNNKNDEIADLITNNLTWINVSKISVNALNVQALMEDLYVIDSEKIIIAKYLLRNMGSYVISYHWCHSTRAGLSATINTDVSFVSS